MGKLTQTWTSWKELKLESKIAILGLVATFLALIPTFLSIPVISDWLHNRGTTLEKPPDKPPVVPQEPTSGGTANITLKNTFPGAAKKMLSPPESMSILEHRVEPEYPPEARDSGAQGLVSLLITVDGSGRVINTRLISGHPKLAETAQAAVRQWKFKPYVAEGKVVSSWATTVNVRVSPK